MERRKTEGIRVSVCRNLPPKGNLGSAPQHRSRWEDRKDPGPKFWQTPTGLHGCDRDREPHSIYHLQSTTQEKRVFCSTPNPHLGESPRRPTVLRGPWLSSEDPMRRYEKEIFRLGDPESKKKKRMGAIVRNLCFTTSPSAYDHNSLLS